MGFKKAENSEHRSTVRQDKLGVHLQGESPCREGEKPQASLPQGLTNHPYRVLRMNEEVNLIEAKRQRQQPTERIM